MTRREFERVVEEAVKSLPDAFRARIENVVIRVSESPSKRQSRAPEVKGHALYGLYEGTPLPERQWADGNRLPDRVTIFQAPIEEDCEDEDDVRAVIGETLIHEIGHYFGLSEAEIEEIEERYWRGETLGPDEDDEE